MRWALILVVLAGCQNNQQNRPAPLTFQQEMALERCEHLIDDDNAYFKCVDRYNKLARHCTKLGKTAGWYSKSRRINSLVYEDCLIRQGLELP